MANYYSETRVIRVLKIRRDTLRKMEEEGVVVPATRGGRRRYTEEQVADLMFAKDLIHEMGVNWAGAVVAIRMKRNMTRMESQIEQIFEYIRQRLEEDLAQD